MGLDDSLGGPFSKWWLKDRGNSPSGGKWKNVHYPNTRSPSPSPEQRESAMRKIQGIFYWLGLEMRCVTSSSVVLARNSHSVPHTCKGDEKRAPCLGTPVLSPEVLIGRHALSAWQHTALLGRGDHLWYLWFWRGTETKYKVQIRYWEDRHGYGLALSSSSQPDSRALLKNWLLWRKNTGREGHSLGLLAAVRCLQALRWQQSTLSPREAFSKMV